MDANQDAPHQRSFRVAYHGCAAVGPGEIAKITFFIIASAVANLHVESGHPSRNGDLDMRIIFDDGDRFGYRSVRRCFWPDGCCKRRAPSFPPDLKASVHASSARLGRAFRICLSGQIISNRPPWPEWIMRRKPCNFTIAATRFRPRPTPGVLRILSER
jgi:hypothetical protein